MPRKKGLYIRTSCGLVTIQINNKKRYMSQFYIITTKEKEKNHLKTYILLARDVRENALKLHITM